MADADTLVLRGGTIVDGTGRTPFEADVVVREGRIVAVGNALTVSATEELDARGCLVTPGFVDIHTHYDGQASWSERLTPSSWHGVSTVIMGNCGVGFAPCRPENHDMLIRLMEGVEDIPGIVLADGLPWSWESFPEYLDFLASRQFDVDIAAQLPHAALRVYVMGERGARREPATADDRARMREIASEAIRAGALGFSTSRTLNHRTSDGDPTPMFEAAGDELTTIASALRDAGRGVLQFVTDLAEREDWEREWAMLHGVIANSRRPASIALTQREANPDGWRRVLDAIGHAAAAGLPVVAQVFGRPVGVLFGLELSENPFCSHPSYRAIAGFPLERRVPILRDPSFRARLLAETPAPELSARLFTFERMFALGDPPDYEPPLSESIAARATRAGRRPDDLAYDLLLERNGRAMLYRPLLNYFDGTLDAVLQMMRDPNTVLGLGDGGAHYGLICDASIPTYMLAHWVRDRVRGEKLSLPWVINALTARPAAAVGLLDRGVVAPGMKADLNIIDLDRLRLHAPQVVYDLPRGGRRLVQGADGYVATIVNGVVTSRNGEAIGALPGRLVRGPRPSLY